MKHSVPVRIDQRTAKICPHGIWGWDGEAYFATVADSAESLARFGPPGSGPGTPTPGFDLGFSLLIGAVAADC